MIINPIGAFVNIGRAYEVARVANMRLAIVFPDMISKSGEDHEYDPDKDFIEGDKKQLLTEFYTDVSNSWNGYVYAEATRPTFEELTRESESLHDIEARVTAAKMILEAETPKHDMNPSASALLKTAYNRLNLSIEDMYNIRKCAVAIAKLDKEDTVRVEHYAEAINLQSYAYHVKKAAREFSETAFK